MTLAATAWAAGRLDGRGGGAELLFGRMYEDPAIELSAFRPGARVFCIASAGDTARALSSRHEVVAVDLNPAQLAYAKRRLSGGPYAPGAAERLMSLARGLAPLVGWRRSLLLAFLDLDDPAEQAVFWRRRLDTLRLRAALGTLFWAPLLRAFYSGPLVGALPPRFGGVLRERLARGFSRHPNRSNPFARALLLGEAPEAAAAPAAGRVRLVGADAAAFLEGEPRGGFDGFTLSNVLDGAAPEYARRLAAAVQRAAAPGAVVVWRSFDEPRQSLPGNHAADDRSLLWGIVRVGPAASPPP